MHPLAALLHSLVPWFRLRERAAADAGVGAAPAGAPHPLADELAGFDDEDVRRQQQRTLEALRGHQGQELQVGALARSAAWPVIPLWVWHSVSCKVGGRLRWAPCWRGCRACAHNTTRYRDHPRA